MQEHALFHPSILNRLIDLDPLNNEPSAHHSASFREVEEMVLSDLEQLLNSRKPLHDIPDNCEQTKRSLLTYGLRDSSADNPASPMVRQQLCREVSKTIALFEPRLQNVQVRVDSDSHFRGLQFKISAILDVAPFKETVYFDTFLDPGKGRFLIES